MGQTLNAKNIKAQLKARKVSQAAIAKMLKVHPVCINEVVYGKRRNPRIRLAIAMALGKPVSEVWPDDGQKNTSTPADGDKAVVGDGGRTPDPSRGRGCL